jgi:hypothetical protein
MKLVTKYSIGVVIFSLVLGGVLSTGVLAAEPGDGEPGGGESQYGTFFWVGIGAIVGIATIAIWQGVDDANKKKEEEQVREAEDTEIEDFGEYFRSIPAEEAGGSDDTETEDDSEPEYVKPLIEQPKYELGISVISK